MKMKLLMQWDIRSGRDSQYLEFIVGEFLPSVARLGLEIKNAWYTLYGDVPQILISGVAPSGQALHEILGSQEWESLLATLSQYVNNFQTKIVPDRDRFQF
jgi:hypothetical protein